LLSKNGYALLDGLVYAVAGDLKVQCAICALIIMYLRFPFRFPVFWSYLKSYIPADMRIFPTVLFDILKPRDFKFRVISAGDLNCPEFASSIINFCIFDDNFRTILFGRRDFVAKPAGPPNSNAFLHLKY